MKESIADKVVQSLTQASRHNSNVMAKPEVILWPDPERQWQVVIPQLQERLPALLVYGHFKPEQKQGPAIWLKCMVSRILPEADWPTSDTPILYLPGISKQDFKNISSAELMLQPLMEYQYTGTLWLHENGREWTIPAFIQNAQAGLGLKMAQDNATKDAVLTAIGNIFEDKELFFNKAFVDAEFLLSTVFPDINSSILKWMADPEGFTKSLSPDMRQTFITLCQSRFEFEPDAKNIKEITLKLGAQKNAWQAVWQYYANAPRKFPHMPELLRLAKPDDLGSGMFALPSESWPQVNEEKEAQLRTQLTQIAKRKSGGAAAYLAKLQTEHSNRKQTVWYELGLAPLVDALAFLTEMAQYCEKPYPSNSLDELACYYAHEGYRADQLMRKALASVSSVQDRDAVIEVIAHSYRPWLEKITEKFQSLLKDGSSDLTSIKSEKEEDEFVLFVDALRYELAVEFTERLTRSGLDVALTRRWSPLPTLTPTAKALASPLAELVNVKSECNEFRPQLRNGKGLLTGAFRDALEQVDFTFVPNISELVQSKKTWMEIGDIDTKGHQEQALMVRRIDELFRTFHETIEAALGKGVKQIKVVTDHGWLLLPGGLPKKELSRHLVETRWGRCALLKEGATTDLLHLPWQWNSSVYVAYAPGISFFKKNEAYAHGGLSLQECLVPEMIITAGKKDKLQGKIVSITWTRCNGRIEVEAQDGYLVDIRTKATDETTSIVLSKSERRVVKDSKVTLLVDDDHEGGTGWVVLTTPNGTIVDKQMTAIGQ